jgi:hypothetical protein
MNWIKLDHYRVKLVDFRDHGTFGIHKSSEFNVLPDKSTTQRIRRNVQVDR